MLARSAFHPPLIPIFYRKRSNPGNYTITRLITVCHSSYIFEILLVLRANYKCTQKNNNHGHIT